MYPEIDFLVGIHCITYNQSSYITDALNGFTMQQTNFPFVAIIIDDASTDGEQDVIRKYVEEYFDHTIESGYREWETEDAYWSFARHKANVNCHFVTVFLKKNLYQEPNKKSELIKKWMDVKYIAICEGDDYWIDSSKLQKQVDYLVMHEDVSLCYHNVKVWIQNEGVMADDFITRDVPEKTDFHELVKGNYIHTPSVVYRHIEEVDNTMSAIGWLGLGDYPRWIMLSKYGSVVKLSETMAVYRHGTGMWANAAYTDRCIDTMIMYAKLAPLMEDECSRKLLDDQLLSLRNEVLLFDKKREKDINELRSSRAYKWGNYLLNPYLFFKHMLKR